MRLFLLPRRAKCLTERFLSSQQYHQNGGVCSSSGPPFSHPPNTTKGLKSIVLPSYLRQSSGYIANLQPSSLFLGNHYGTKGAIQNSTESLSRVNGIEADNQESGQENPQMISRETVKPASPTPDHLRTFNFSIIDQFFYNHHTPLVLFLPNADDASVSDVITKRSNLLKESLSELLTRYYPFAGEIKDDLHIECNDKGVDFVEARVNQTLKDFLRQPHDQKLRQLVPKLPGETESSPGNYVLSVQVNIFNCGGIGLSTRSTHKIIDFDTWLTFMDAWAATARGSADKITPSFLAYKIFPNNPSLKYSLPSKLLTTKQTATKIFVFDSTALSTLKAQLVGTAAATSPGPTRVEATGALIWKAASKAASTVRQFSPQSPHSLLPLVNLRKRASPPLPRECIGNLVIPAVGICHPDSQPDLPTLMGQIRESIAKINPEFIEALKGEKGHQTVDSMLKMFNDFSDVLDEGNCVLLTSLLNSGIYQIDFGWGKPIWFYFVNPGTHSIIALNDTVKSGGVEASVTLSPEEMEVFEREPDILSYACVNPSPLE